MTIKRYFEENRAYFATTITKDRKQLFRNEKLSKILLMTVEYYKIILDYAVYGYCLMPDHFHVIIHPKGEFTLSFIMKMIKGSFARKMNKLKQGRGSLWQQGFYDEMIRDERQLLKQLEYIHQNPVAANLVESADKYPYSSFSQYYGTPNLMGHILEIDRG